MLLTASHKFACHRYVNTGKGGITTVGLHINATVTRSADASVAARVFNECKHSEHVRLAAATTAVYSQFAEMEAAASGRSVEEVLRDSNPDSTGVFDAAALVEPDLNSAPRYSPVGATAFKYGHFKATPSSIGVFKPSEIRDFSGAFNGFSHDSEFYQNLRVNEFFANEDWVFDQLNSAQAGTDVCIDWTYNHAKRCVVKVRDALCLYLIWILGWLLKIHLRAFPPHPLARLDHLPHQQVETGGKRVGPFSRTVTAMNQHTGKLVVCHGVHSEAFDVIRATLEEILVDRQVRLEEHDAALRSHGLVPIYDVRQQKTRHVTMDKCCEFRAKLREVSNDSNLSVWLDGTHYIGRYNKVAPKWHPCSGRISSSISAALYQPDPTELIKAQAVWATEHPVRILISLFFVRR